MYVLRLCEKALAARDHFRPRIDAMLTILLTAGSTEPSPDAASTLPDLYRVFNPAEIVSVEPTSIDRPVAGR